MKIVYLFLIVLFASCNVDSHNLNKERREIVLENKVYRTIGYSSVDVVLKGTSSLTLIGTSNQILDNSTVNLEGEDAWLYLSNVSFETWNNDLLYEKIKINSEKLIVGENAHLIRFYNGVYVKPIISDNYVPLYIYGSHDDKSYPVLLNRIYKGDEIPVGENLMERFFLKRGHMLVLAENVDGTGASQVFVAANNHKEITLSSNLKGKVSFMRVVPWNYTTKKGIGGRFFKKNELGISWFYTWGLKEEATVLEDFAPMFWGNSSEEGVNQVLQKKLTNHVLSFNEPDGKDQANLTPQKALEYYPILLKMGLRMGSPACTESKWNTWLAEFMKGCNEKQYRVDYIAIHWYDWGNWGATKDPSPKDIDSMVNRFKKYIDDCYAKYGLPIWITEFNANKNRTTETQIRFLEKALPMLEAHPHVERYAYFQPFGGNGNFIENKHLTDVAHTYGRVKSRASYAGE